MSTFDPLPFAPPLFLLLTKVQILKVWFFTKIIQIKPAGIGKETLKKRNRFINFDIIKVLILCTYNIFSILLD